MQYIIIRKSIFFIFSTSSFYHMSPDVQHLRQFMTKLFGPIVNNIYRRDDRAGVETTKDISFSYFRLYPINCTDLAVISFHVTFQLHKTSQTKKVFLADRCSQAFNCVSLKVRTCKYAVARARAIISQYLTCRSRRPTTPPPPSDLCNSLASLGSPDTSFVRRKRK